MKKKEKTSAIATEIKKLEKVSISREKRRAEPGTSVTWSCDEKFLLRMITFAYFFLIHT